MASLLYFVPDCALARVSRASELPPPFDAAIGKIVGAASLDSRRCTGPSGCEGLMFQAEPAHRDGIAAVVEYQPDRQRWTQVIDSRPAERGRWHAVGYWLHARPTPDDLVRPYTCSGHAVELHDGQQWVFPVVGPLMTTLPQSFRRVAERGFEPGLRAEFEPLFAESQTWYERVAAGGSYLHSEFFRFAVEALAVNYRVGLDECSGELLDLIGADHFKAVMDVCLGFRTVLEADARKKKE